MSVENRICFVRTDLYFVENNVLLLCVFCGMVWMFFDVLRFVLCSALFLPVQYSLLCKMKLFVLCDFLCIVSSVLLGLCSEFCSNMQ
jgi:hypothetical protein